MQPTPEKFATIKYEDTDNNGFFDTIRSDLDGDNVFEDSVSFKALGIDDKQTVFSGESMTQLKAQERFKSLTEAVWQRAQQVITLSVKMGLPTEWYNFYKKPRSLHQKYEYGFWLNFYIYDDLRNYFKTKAQSIN